MSIGGHLWNSERSKALSPSIPILHVSLGFAYREDSLAVMSANQFTAPFQFILWLTLMVILLIIALLILLTKKLTRKWRHFYIGGRVNRTPVLNVWSVVLGKAIGNPRIANGQNFGTFARTLMLFWILLWFFIRSFYEGIVLSKLQNDRIESPFDTIEKIQTSNCYILAAPSAITFIAHLFEKDR